MKDHSKASFEVHKAGKDKTCIWCGKAILKGETYYSKPENSKMIDKLLEKETGWDIYTIKSRTHFWYCDRVSWPFCSYNCMGNFSRFSWETLPFSVRGRMGAKIVAVVTRIKDSIALMTALEGSEDKPKSEGEDA